MHTQTVRDVIDENTDGVAAARGDDHAIRSLLSKTLLTIC
ncbi:hypothetical protein ABIB66_008986, partial [Bradyrhizobium sp. F1.13.3]